jgi:hypothetical protein
MVSNGSVPWYDRPARPFPALVWLEKRYPFRVSPLVFSRRLGRLPTPEEMARRPFPALVWLEARQN